MTKKSGNGPKQHHDAAPGGRPVLDAKTEEMIETKQRDHDAKSARHSYAVENKRTTARIEHTNGSTPRRDQ